MEDLLCRYLFGFHVFGLGFVTSMAFIFATGKCLKRQLCSASGLEAVVAWGAICVTATTGPAWFCQANQSFIQLV